MTTVKVCVRVCVWNRLKTAERGKEGKEDGDSETSLRIGESETSHNRIE